MSRRRVYELYGWTRGGPFTVRSICYSQGTHRWCYQVYATSVRQAYMLAAREVWAADARSVGVRRIERDWWHDSTTPGPGDRTLAPYLQPQAVEA